MSFDQPELLFSDIIRINARLFNRKPAVVCGDEQLSWTDFHLRTNKVANALIGLGVRKGDKICVLADSSIPAYELLWGVVKAGAVFVGLNVLMARDSLALMINNCDAAILVGDPGTASQIDPLRSALKNIKPDGMFLLDAPADTTTRPGCAWRAFSRLVDTASDAEPNIAVTMQDSISIIYTSGSTGAPKGIEHNHFSRLTYALGLGWMLGIDRFSVIICPTPLYTTGTWMTMLPALYCGATVVLLKKFGAKPFVEAVERNKCTHVFMVPTQYIVVLESGELERHNTSSFQVLLHGGQAIAPATLEKMREKFPQAKIYESYGNTEAFICIATPKDRLAGKVRSVGHPLFGGDVRIIDPDGKELPLGEAGEIVAWGPAMMKGYYNNPEATQATVWRDARGRTYMRTGDYGRLDEDGYVHILGRIKDMIKSGGLNIFASDIEDVFMQHPDVSEAAAIGIPHEKWVETPLLLAIMRPNAKTTEEELREWGNSRLGKFQRVSRVEFRPDFPRATYNKVMKRTLREPYWPPEH
jgi:long-chain acyl-CoA synthetase